MLHISHDSISSLTINIFFVSTDIKRHKTLTFFMIFTEETLVIYIVSEKLKGCGYGKGGHYTADTVCRSLAGSSNKPNLCQIKNGLALI